MVLYVLRADGVLAGHAVYNVHAVPMTGNNADGSGGDLAPNAGLEMKKKTQITICWIGCLLLEDQFGRERKKLFTALL